MPAPSVYTRMDPLLPQHNKMGSAACASILAATTSLIYIATGQPPSQIPIRLSHDSSSVEAIVKAIIQTVIQAIVQAVIQAIVQAVIGG